MCFLDKAKAAANELAQKAETALASSGLGGPGASAERYLRDLGVIAYLENAGRPLPAEERDRVLGALRDLEQIRASYRTSTGKEPASPTWQADIQAMLDRLEQQGG